MKCIAWSRDSKLLSARAVQHEYQSQHSLRSPTSCTLLCPGVICFMLTPPLQYAAVVVDVGPYERLLRDGTRAIRARCTAVDTRKVFQIC
jgi:hypothetical protein